jgi:6-pyruvoyltetrahydropterin/6-carboxytetrahydropterin synthase
MYTSTKVIELGSCAFRQWGADHSHCHFIHGYQLKAKFWFGCSELDNKNWAVDFGGLKSLKAQLQDVFDHTLCVAANDPCLDLFRELERRDAVKLRVFEKGVGIERASELCYNIASSFIQSQYGDRCWVEKVEVFEHEDNSAVYKPTRTPATTAAETTSEVKQVAAVEVTPLPNAPEHNPRAAHVGSNVSSGKGNWFQGTTWS